MSYKIHYADGRKASVDSLNEAATVIARQYPDAVYCDNGDAVSQPYEREIDNAGRILVWDSESAADGPDGMGDAGQEAVAEILPD